MGWRTHDAKLAAHIAALRVGAKMTEVRTQPVKAQLVDVVNSESPPGAYKFYVSGESVYQKWENPGDRKPAGMIYACPCGCGDVGYLRFRPCQPEHPSWDWDGSREAPTLSPSVWDREHWHGWLQEGVWRSV